MGRTIRVLGVLLAAMVAVLVVTGAWLVFEYRPGPPNGMRRAHQVASTAAVWTSVALFVATVIRQRLRPALVAAGSVLAVAALAATGPRLRWDQLALWAVTVGVDYSGVLTAGSNEVRAVLFDGVAIGTDTYRRWTLVHTVLVPGAAALGAAAWYGRKFLLRR